MTRMWGRGGCWTRVEIEAESHSRTSGRVRHRRAHCSPDLGRRFRDCSSNAVIDVLRNGLAHGIFH